MKNRWFLRIVLVYNFILPALLLNCVGIVILKLINSYGVSMPTASWLEAFKDVSIFAGSFIIASYIPRLGYKKSMMLGIFLEMIGSLIMALFPSIVAARIYFVCVGVGFALIKVAVYSSIGLITTDDDQHAGYLSMFEGMFMVGVLSGYWLFGIFMEYKHWTGVFQLMAGLTFLGLILFSFAYIDESRLTQITEDHIDNRKVYHNMFGLLTQSLVWLFFALIFFYLFLEQGIMDWLPTFDNHILKISAASSVEIASLLSGGLALGRLFFGMIMQYVHWRRVLMFCVLGALLVLSISVYSAAHLTPATCTLTQWRDFPCVAYLLPCIGFLVGPIYPTLCSSILRHQPVKLQSAMTIWIVIFSALGGAMGSRILGGLFNVFGGLTAFGILFVPLVVLLFLILPYEYRLTKSSEVS